MTEPELCFLSARELAARIRCRDLSAREVLEAHLAQVEHVNPKVNAIVTLTAERAMEAAVAADEALARGEPIGVLHGLPVVHKDLVPTKGVRTTQGSPIFANQVPDRDGLIVERLRNAGAIMIGKSNTPEFGAGSQTFNPVFGATLNPHDLSRTCGGSSGGAAVSLACGLVPIADGSDTGGSLRNPAAFCNVVGLRTTPGRVPTWPSAALWNPLPVQGPMGRTAEDVALMLSAIAGPDPRTPLAINDPGLRFARALDRDLRGVRVAWSPTLGGLPIDPEVVAVLAEARKAVEALGCVVEDVDPDLSGADEVFEVFRAVGFNTGLGPVYDRHPDQVKESVAWNIAEGRALTGEQVANAERLRTALFARFQEFMTTYEFVLCPVTQVPPFPVDVEYPTEVAGVQMQSYIEWMRSCCRITSTSHPAASVPGGFTAGGLPVGLQVVGRYGGEFSILQFAHAFQQATRHHLRRPAVAL